MKTEEKRRFQRQGKPPIEPLGETVDDHTLLMYRAAQGDRDAYAHIYDFYRPAVEHYLLNLNGQGDRHDLNDMIQEALFRGWKRADKFQGKSSVKTYLFSVAKNVWREHLNRYTTEHAKQQKEVYEDGRIGTVPPPEDLLSHREAIHKLKEAIATLSKKQRQIMEIILKEGDISMAEAARRAGLSESAFRHRLLSAKRHLRDVCRREDLL